MLKVNKKEEPDFFLIFKRYSNPKDWDDYTTNIKRRLKKYMLKNEQYSFCPYCERKIKVERSQIEHIKPKGKFPELLNEYSNYLTGCLEYHRTCGSSKGNKWDKNFINPVRKNPEEYFIYELSTGRIIPNCEDGRKKAEAEKTIEILNLNERRLCEQRKRYISKVVRRNGTIDYKIINYIDEFPTLKRYLLKI
ncbi:MAG: TIGR02646 family protein [Leptotrichiaceae bacterium]|nr:TIGR02646 family protein [Leptotrichiaceae bacterium]